MNFTRREFLTGVLGAPQALRLTRDGEECGERPARFTITLGVLDEVGEANSEAATFNIGRTSITTPAAGAHVPRLRELCSKKCRLAIEDMP